MLLYTTNAVMMRLTLDPTTGHYLYNPISVTLLCEVLKLFVSCLLVPAEALENAAEELRWNSVWPYGIPGLVYLIDDNLQYGIYLYLRPSEATLWANVRILTTAAIFRVLIRRRLSHWQWSSLVILTAGLVLAQSGQIDSVATTEDADANGTVPPPPPPLRLVLADGERTQLAHYSAKHGRLSDTSVQTADGDAQVRRGFFGLNLGHALILVVALIGSFGNVFGERLLKRDLEDSLHVQNAKLYAWGVLLNLVAFFWYGRANDDIVFGSLFQGWTPAVVVICLCQAAIGLCISLMFKYIDNLFKVWRTNYRSLARRESLALTHAVALIIALSQCHRGARGNRFKLPRLASSPPS